MYMFMYIYLNQQLDCALIIAKPSLLDWQYAADSCKYVFAFIQEHQLSSKTLFKA
jgi:hypothetical protein